MRCPAGVTYGTRAASCDSSAPNGAVTGIIVTELVCSYSKCCQIQDTAHSKGVGNNVRSQVVSVKTARVQFSVIGISSLFGTCTCPYPVRPAVAIDGARAAAISRSTLQGAVTGISVTEPVCRK